MRGLPFVLYFASQAACGAAVLRNELTFVTTELPDGNREVPYQAQLEATGGTSPYEWSAANLPPGLSVDSDGQIAGTPSEAGRTT